MGTDRSQHVTNPSPNILIIYPDQMRGDAMGCIGNTCIKTPHFDRLANEGVLFENAFTSYPLCSPFRASLFTGKYAHSNGVYANHYPIPLDQDFLAKKFKEEGYQTAYFGKWHLAGGASPGFIPPGNKRLGFDHFIGFNRGHHYFNSIYFKDTDQPYSSHRYEPDYQTDQLIGFLDQWRMDKEDSPFFAMINYGLPHPPLEAPDHYINLYSAEEVPILTAVPKDADSQRASREFLAKYYGLIACVDHNLGKVLDWLDRWNIADETVVILVSDHGELAGEHGRYAKRNYHRGASHVPLIIRYPKRFPAGNIVQSIVDPSVDTMPTLLELCNISVPEDIQGVSYLPLLDGETRLSRDAVFYEILMELEGPERFPVPERGVRTLEWLYVRNETAPIALYNLTSDPFELNNLVDSPEYLGKIRSLDGLLKEHMSLTGDDWRIGVTFPPQDYQSYEQGDRNVIELLRHAIIES